MPEATPLLIAAVFAVALLYSSVGHGGASGYLAVLALVAVSPKTASTSALLLNLLVAGTAWIAFWRAGHFSWSLVWPFVAGSIPAALVGGALRVDDALLYALLALVLVSAAVSMALPRPPGDDAAADRRPRMPVCAGVGALLGIVSGIVGVGGGIFLSPLMIVRRWASPKRVAAASACFIVLNSAAGLAGRLGSRPQGVLGMMPFVAAAFAGGLIGGWLGARRLTPVWLRRLLSVVLLVAAYKSGRQATGV